MNPRKSIAGIFINSKSIKNHSTVILIIFAGLLILPSLAQAAIGRISSFKGEVIVQSGDNVTKVVAPGHQVNNGDMVLTKKGEAQVTFADGGIVRVNPFTQIMIQERKEESGILFFKKTNVARRVTCYLGKFWFKSGLSRTTSYMQSPTAVAGVRGSDGDYGYNPATMQTYMNMYSGEATVVGNVIRGFFENPGISAAAKAQVYQSLVQAYNKTEQARVTGKVIDQAQAKVDALKVVKEAATILIQNNPDATVKQQAQIANATADASISAANARVSAEQVKEAQKEAEKAAKEEKNPAKAKEAEQAALKAAEATRAAEVAAAAAAAAAAKAKVLADAPNPNLNQLNQVAQQASQAAAVADTVQKEAAPTTIAPTTAAPTTAPNTVAPTTVPATVPATEIITTVITSVQTTTSTSSVKPISPP